MIRRIAVILLLVCCLHAVAVGATKQAQVMALSVKAVRVNLTPTEPAKIGVSLHNVSSSSVIVDGRFTLGGGIDLYAINASGTPFQLAYPEGSIPPAGKNDFVTLAPGKSIGKIVEVRWSMLPQSMKQSGPMKLTVRVTIGDPGERFGLRAWTGSLKTYVVLELTPKRAGHRPGG